MNPLKHSLSYAVLALSLVLAGCSLAPPHQRPAAPLPIAWKSDDNATARGGTQAQLAGDLEWTSFVTDPGLRDVIGRALVNNRSLRQTLLNVETVRAQYRIERANRTPTVMGQADGLRQRAPVSVVGAVPGVAAGSGVQSYWQAGVGVTAFELDLFGRVRNLSEAALEEYLASEHSARSVRITLISEVIRTYISRDSALHRQLLAAQTLRSREASLQVVVKRRQAGTATGLDYQQARGLAEQARADIERIGRELRQSANALELLVGGAEPAPPIEPSTAPMLVQDLAAGTPSDLLHYRPDIIAAEHRLRARNASIGAARAAFFPRIALTGMLGSSSGELNDLFSSGGRTWSFAPQLTLPILDGGRNSANLDLARVRKDIAIAAYEETVQTAFREVSDALTAVDTLRREELARRALANSSDAALRLAEARWRAGVDDQLRYLDAQRSAFSNRMSSIEISTELQMAMATLFTALGGGWTMDERVAFPAVDDAVQTRR